MLKIVIYDRNVEFATQLSGWIKSFLDNRLFKGVLLNTECTEDNIEKVITENEANVFLLDIDLGLSQNGLDLAKKIREKKSNAYIVFITEHLEFMLPSFKARPFDFIPKPITEAKLKQCLLEINNDFTEIKDKNEENYIQVKFSSTLYRIKKDEIVYIEKFGNVSTIHTIDNKISCYESLEKFETLLDDPYRFIRCHKSYIVNRRFITELHLNTMEILLRNGMKCYIGRKYKKDLMKTCQ